MKGIRIKKIDSLLFTSFIPPFFVTFAIAVFVLVMQTLWLYIDDIAGKGLGLFLIIELLAYKSVALFPLALPLGILISSVMVLGNMAERYELSSLKSAGVPLSRIMRPILFFALICGVFSYYCSNTLMPMANLKFGSRMYDIQQQKPTLQLEEGVFNDDFRGFAIRIGRKEADQRTIHDVLLYDHNSISQGQFTQIVAKNGEMYSSPDGKYFIMHLKDVYQYVETRANSFSSTDGSYPFVRTHFNEWFKVFDLSEFELNRTNEELFKSNRSMMSIKELRSAIDSMTLKILKREVVYSNTVARYFFTQEIDSTIIKLEALERENDEEYYEEQYETDESDADSTGAGAVPSDMRAAAETTAKEKALIAERERAGKAARDSTNGPANGTLTAIVQSDSNATDSLPAQPTLASEKTMTAPETVKLPSAPIKPENKIPKKVMRGPKPLPQDTLADLSSIQSFVELFPKEEHGRLYNRAQNTARSVYSQAESAARALERDLENQVKYIYEMHTKYSLAVVCVIFLFIGAPMGAIIRKGGFGYPILISIIFFMLFVVLTIFCRKIAESFVLPAWLAAWLPCLVLAPIGALLTTKAMNDSKVLDFDSFAQRMRRLFGRASADTKILDANES